MFKVIKLFIVFLSVIGILSFSGCSKDDDPVSAQANHFEAIGVYLSTSGITLASILRGVTDDTLFAPLGGLSEHINVQFYDKNENIIDPPTDEDHSFSWTIDDTSIVGVWQHEGEEGGYEFHLKGKKMGTTYIEFFVLHGDHSDYRSGKIPVTIINVEGTHSEPVGLKLIDEESGNVLVTVNSDGTVAGDISVNAGSETDHIEVVFFDENNVEFQPAVPVHSLGFLIADETVAGVEGPTDDEPWAFHVLGKKAGTTSIILKLFHEENVGFTSSPVTINVR